METMKPVLDSLDNVINTLETTLNPPKPEPNSQPDKSDTTQTSAPAETPSEPAGKPAKKKKEKKPKQPAPAVDPVIANFLQCDLRVGQIVKVDGHPEADGLYVLEVSYGNDVTKTVCAGLRKFVPEDEMMNRRVVTICNLKPRKLRGVPSEAMILAGSVVSGEGEKETVVPIAPPESADIGAIVKARGIEGERTVVDGKYVSSKTWDKVVPKLSVKEGHACYDDKPLYIGDDNVKCALPDGAEIH